MALKRMDNVGIVVDDLTATIDFLLESGSNSKGERSSKEYRLCYIRGPEGLLFGLAQELTVSPTVA